LGDGLQIVASITKEAVQELELRRGREATALIKSSFVLLSMDPQARTSARNRLRGRVARVIGGAVNSEVVLELPGGRRLIAMVTNESCQELQLAPGSECCALIKASHVILAVGD
jgi:molybdate transport system regulatory protein